jgi:hypothetical protein
MKRRTFLTIGLILSLMMITFPASAARVPLDVHIVSVMDFTSGENFGTFEATGPAVDEGYLCPSGMVYDDPSTMRISGGQSGRVLQIYVHKLFVCSDSGETFEMDMHVFVHLDPWWTTAHWRFTGGSGPYAGIKGTGSLYGSGTESEFFDIYDGFVLPY